MGRVLPAIEFTLRTRLRGRLLWRRAEHQEVNDVVHILIVLAVILFVLWLLFHATGALVNLLWIGIVVLAILWLVGLFRGRSTTI
jgi:predicted RND superfamily exporter protein